jgi:hypothetical protein
MVAIKPANVLAQGADSWGFAPAVADILVPKVSELDAITGLNLSCILFAEQEGLTGTTEKVTLPLRMCETVGFEANGVTTYAMSDLVAAYEPQAAAGSDGKKAWETLTDGIIGYLWQRQGVPSNDDLEVGQFVHVVPVQLGTKVPGKTSTGADGVYTFTQPVSITAAPSFSVPLVA